MTHHVLHILGTARPEGAGITRIVSALAAGLDPARYHVHAWFLGGDGPLVAEVAATGATVRVIKWRSVCAIPWALCASGALSPAALTRLSTSISAPGARGGFSALPHGRLWSSTCTGLTPGPYKPCRQRVLVAGGSKGYCHVPRGRRTIRLCPAWGVPCRTCFHAESSQFGGLLPQALSSHRRRLPARPGEGSYALDSSLRCHPFRVSVSCAWKSPARDQNGSRSKLKLDHSG